MAAQQDWSRSGPEPRVEDIIHDPIVQLVMRRDRLTTAQVLAAVMKARARLLAQSPEIEVA